jgi:hypothetical protein
MTQAEIIEISCEKAGRNFDCLSALDCFPPHKEVIVPIDEIENFIGDCRGWNRAQFDQGLPTSTTIPAATWDEWVEVYAIVEPPAEFAAAVRLFAKVAGEFGEGIGAYCPDDDREVIVPADEKAAFVKDCELWAAERFASGQPVAVVMSAENWAAWLEMFEVADLDDETIDSLCA